jgi:hypothetical protein
MITKPGEPWSDADTNTAIKLAREGRTLCQIGEAVGRSAEAVRSRLKKKLKLKDLPPLHSGTATKSQVEWTEADEQTVMRIIREGGTIVTAGVVVGRSPEAVRKRLKYMRSALVASTTNRVLARDRPVPPRQMQQSEEQGRRLKEDGVRASVLHLIDLMRSFGSATIGEAKSRYANRCEYKPQHGTPVYMPARGLELSYVGSTAALCAGE